MTSPNVACAHILIVEDSLTQAERLKYTLERHHFNVSSARNGNEALSIARAKHPTLIITDIVMPEMDGYELCRQIKADAGLNHVPLMLLTTLSDPQDVIRGLECGADNFVVKPYEDHHLLSRIDYILSNHDLQRPRETQKAIEITFGGQKRTITADRWQILNLLLSTYETAIQRNQELTRTKDALRDANNSLEAANKELETFSYSVSHDLGAPLRAIEGFNRCLLEDTKDNWSAESRDLLHRTQNACIRMKQLIEDLLNLSKIGRSELQRQEVNLSALATTVLRDLQSQQTDRQIQMTIKPDLCSSGDPRLLRIVFENLLGNACKFTAKKAFAEIEFADLYQGQQRVYFVRDNGAGFDMQYVERLFGAFQRLHPSTEFQGTGVGLATVSRIIRRHGGSIWAEGKVNQGATFYFTL